MIIDTNINVMPHLEALRAAGVRTIVRYLDPLNPHGEKCIKSEEARAIAAAALRLALVSEGWGDFAHGAISAGAGERDGEWCARHAADVGAPDGATVYFAVDVDASAGQIRKLVLPYFRAVADVFELNAPHLRIGVYGSGAVCEAVIAAKLAHLSWLSSAMGWRSSREYLAVRKWALRQHLPRHIAGIHCDPNEANAAPAFAGAGFGDFVPFAVGDQTAPASGTREGV